jgi:hypothetical protein
VLLSRRRGNVRPRPPPGHGPRVAMYRLARRPPAHPQVKTRMLFRSSGRSCGVKLAEPMSTPRRRW